MERRCIVVGSRSSLLALKQTREIIEGLVRISPACRFEIKKIKTKADIFKDLSIATSGSVGIFTKELNNALIKKEIDMAVHSMKDLPASLPRALVISCVPERSSPFDALISKDSLKLKELPKAAKVGTSSPRRKAFVLYLRDDLTVMPIRGNIDTRLKKLDSKDFDGIILAQAALIRLGLEHRISEVLKNRDFLPQAGQGALAVVTRRGDVMLKELLRKLNHKDSYIEVMAEKAFLSELGGGCQLPVGILAKIKGNSIKIMATILTADGKKKFSKNIQGKASEALILAKRLAREFKKEGII